MCSPQGAWCGEKWCPRAMGFEDPIFADQSSLCPHVGQARPFYVWTAHHMSRWAIGRQV